MHSEHASVQASVASLGPAWRATARQIGQWRRRPALARKAESATVPAFSGRPVSPLAVRVTIPMINPAIEPSATAWKAARHPHLADADTTG
jgi:hypothetical protein